MIEAEGLVRSFGDQVAVNDLNLRVPPGEIFGFLGPNGAGKTTTIRMLCGLLRPDRGSVRIAGHDLSSAPEQVRKVIALVPDTPPLYEYLTGREYIAFVASLYGVAASDLTARSQHYLERFGLTDRADDLCKGYSHGMRKKIHIAAVLVTSPQVILLDEPTNGLDPAAARALKDVLIETRDNGATLFLSTHLLPTAEEICDRVGILLDGRLVAEGTMAELRDGQSSTLEDIFLRLTEEAATMAQQGTDDAAV